MYIYIFTVIVILRRVKSYGLTTASCTHEANQRFKSNTPVTLNQMQLNVNKIQKIIM